jgi:hypothetical protein
LAQAFTYRAFWRFNLTRDEGFTIFLAEENVRIVFEAMASKQRELPMRPYESPTSHFHSRQQEGFCNGFFASSSLNFGGSAGGDVPADFS